MSSKEKKQFALPKLSKKLKQARKQKGITQGQLSQKIGADIQRISKYERGILIPTTEIMIKLSNALDVSLDYLLKNDKNRVTSKVKNAELIDQFVWWMLCRIRTAICSKFFLMRLSKNTSLKHWQ